MEEIKYALNLKPEPLIPVLIPVHNVKVHSVI